MQLFYWDFLEDVSIVKQRINAGKIIVGESDTVIGLFALCAPGTLQKLNEIKGRSNKPCILLVSDIEKVKKMVNPIDREILLKLGSIVWPGPITVIVRASEPYLYMAALDGTIAIRIPGDESIRLFLKDFDALFSTSANKHKESIPLSIDDINQELLDHVDAKIVFKEQRAIKKPSTIIKLEENVILTLRGALESTIIDTLLQYGFTVAVPGEEE